MAKTAEKISKAVAFWLRCRPFKSYVTKQPVIRTRKVTASMYRTAVRCIGLAVGVCCACAVEAESTDPAGQLQQALSPKAVPFAEAPMVGPVSFEAIAGSSDSMVRTVLVTMDRAYVGGKFKVSYNGFTYKNLVAFDLPSNPTSSPTLVTDFKPNPNNTVWALADDFVNIYVGGEFSTIGPSSASRGRLAAVNRDTGAPTSFQADVSGDLGCGTCKSSDPFNGHPGVHALAVASGNLIVGGNFTTLQGVSRKGIGAVGLDSGQLDPSAFATGVTDGFVSTLLWAPGVNAVYVGGSFQTFEGMSRKCVAAATPQGQVSDITFTFTCKKYTSDKNYSQVKDFVVEWWPPTGEGAKVYVALGGRGTGDNNRVAAFPYYGGSPIWKSTSWQGDVQAVDFHDGIVYFGVHDGVFKEGDTYKIAALDSETKETLPDMAHQNQVCDSSHLTNCWLPIANGGMWGVQDIQHYTTDSGAQLLVGGAVTSWNSVANSKFFAVFPTG